MTIEKDYLRKKVDDLKNWYHKIELPYGIVTPGQFPIHPPSYRIPDSLEGKRVLDIGAWDGYWTFEALKRGAKEVIAIDDFSDLFSEHMEQFMGEKINKTIRRAWDTFDLCRSAFGYSEDICKRIEIPVYDINENNVGLFDVVFFFGTFYHLRHPLLALDKISAICNSVIYVESAILDDFSPYRGGFGQGYPGNQMVMEFYPGNQYGDNETNWWVPTLYCMMSMIWAAGFENVEGWKLTDNPTELGLCRGFVKGIKK
jgi:tRNA (mo5U34)-methyltransferase